MTAGAATCGGWPVADNQAVARILVERREDGQTYVEWGATDEALIYGLLEIARDKIKSDIVGERLKGAMRAAADRRIVPADDLPPALRRKRGV